MIVIGTHIHFTGREILTEFLRQRNRAIIVTQTSQNSHTGDLFDQILMVLQSPPQNGGSPLGLILVFLDNGGKGSRDPRHLGKVFGHSRVI